MSFSDRAGASRWVKLAWITFVSALLGWMLVVLFGAEGHPMTIGLIGVPVLLGLGLGLLGYDLDGTARNTKTVVSILAAIFLAIVILMVAVVYSLSQSTDL